MPVLTGALPETCERPQFMPIPTLITAFLASGGFYLLAPYVFVVNSIPWGLPPTPAELSAIVQSTQVPRVSASTDEVSPVARAFAEQDPGPWRQTGKGHAPRVLLAKLEVGKDLPEVNEYLQSLEPWSVPGSTWELNEGDYDFTETVLIRILYRFGDRPDRLYPDTLKHLLDTLLVGEGGHPTLKVPRTFGLVFDTENHILMTESSRYLKNQWIFSHGDARRKFDNARNGLQEWLLGRLNQIRCHGFHEFNSVPYESYALIALLNLETFAQPPELAALARAIIDDAVYRRAIASMDFRACIPFRRQPEHAGDTRLDIYSLNALVAAWTGQPFGRRAQDRALDAFMSRYRPPAESVALFHAKPREYFVQVGHGAYGSPEIISGGPDYVLSAGGACPDAESQVVPRPTTLLLPDGPEDLDRSFHIPGAGDWLQWNNTGVYRRFACGNRPVHVPRQYRPAAEAVHWKVFEFAFSGRLLLAVWSSDEFGLMALFPDATMAAAELLETLKTANPDADALLRTFRWPDGTKLTYDVHAPYGAWVMQSAAETPLERDYGAWPLIQE